MTSMKKKLCGLGLALLFGGVVISAATSTPSSSQNAEDSAKMAAVTEEKDTTYSSQDVLDTASQDTTEPAKQDNVKPTNQTTSQTSPETHNITATNQPVASYNNYVANTKSGIYHRASCRYVKRMNPGHERFFSTSEEARMPVIFRVKYADLDKNTNVR